MNTPLRIPNAANRSTEIVEMSALVRGIRPKSRVNLVCGRCGKVAGLGREAGWVPVVPVGAGEPLADGLCPDCVADRFTFDPSTD